MPSCATSPRILFASRYRCLQARADSAQSISRSVQLSSCLAVKLAAARSHPLCALAQVYAFSSICNTSIANTTCDNHIPPNDSNAFVRLNTLTCLIGSLRRARKGRMCRSAPTHPTFSHAFPSRMPVFVLLVDVGARAQSATRRHLLLLRPLCFYQSPISFLLAATRVPTTECKAQLEADKVLSKQLH